jgi:flap endonuclease-1
LTHAQFVDLCILLGCDYCDSIKGIGPKTALKLVREHGDIETILKNIDRKKFVVPQSWVPNEAVKDENESSDEGGGEANQDDEEMIPVYVQARQLFNEHDVLTNVELKWKPCQPEALTKFLVDEMGFNPERVRGNIQKLQAAYKANTKPQARMDQFFTAKPNANAGAKRKPETQKAVPAKKKGGASIKKRK